MEHILQLQSGGTAVNNPGRSRTKGPLKKEARSNQCRNSRIAKPSPAQKKRAREAFLSWNSCLDKHFHSQGDLLQKRYQ